MNKNQLEALGKSIKLEIDKYCIATYADNYRWHLGASLIGDECSRKLWYGFRWCNEIPTYKDTKEIENAGRMQRLFQRGHLEEDRFVAYLRGIGCEVWNTDEQGNQFRVTTINGHYGGSCDGVAKLPPSCGIEDPFILEFKTNGTGKGFEELVSKGVQVAKTQHFVQASTYGNELKIQYGLYLNTNKNDDSIHLEAVKLNWSMAEQMKKKAWGIIFSPLPLPRLSEDPTYFKCAYCEFKKLCHEKAFPARNCRSCKHGKPSAEGLNADWVCSIHNGIIPREFVPVGCDMYENIC